MSEPDIDPAGHERTRRSLAWLVVIGYMGLLTINLGGPLVLLITSQLDATEAKDMMLAISSALGGLLGAVGFVVGFYFKTGEPPPALSGRKHDDAQRAGPEKGGGG